MDLRNLTRDDIRQILRASEGIPSQISFAKIEKGLVSPAKTGHALSDHLHSAGFKKDKTKFLSLDDMAEALWRLLQTPRATERLKKLVVGTRITVEADVGQLFGFECEVPDPQGRGTTHQVRFTVQEQQRAGWSKTRCVAVIECRERAGRLHPQIHSFYPAFTPSELWLLLQAVREDV